GGARLAAGGAVAGPARDTLDARGLVVTPGFVDVHTHYDGQATWDAHLAPSCWHGVTTLVFGNCGVGFAPARRDRHDWLIGLMEGVEDIPGAALSAGIRWDWETCPEYLDALARMPRALDVGAQVPHGAVRAYVMGDRGAANEPATPADIETMGRLVREALEAGALGFTTSRTIGHRGVDGRPLPGTFAGEGGLGGIGQAPAAGGGGGVGGGAGGYRRSGRGRSARRGRGRGRVDGAPVGVDQAARLLSRDAERGRSRRMAPAAGSRRPGSGAGRGPRSAGGRAAVRDVGWPPVAREPVRRSPDVPDAGAAAPRRAHRPSRRPRG